MGGDKLTQNSCHTLCTAIAKQKATKRISEMGKDAIQMDCLEYLLSCLSNQVTHCSHEVGLIDQSWIHLLEQLWIIC